MPVHDVRYLKAYELIPVSVITMLFEIYYFMGGNELLGERRLKRSRPRYSGLHHFHYGYQDIPQMSHLPGLKAFQYRYDFLGRTVGVVTASEEITPAYGQYPGDPQQGVCGKSLFTHLDFI